MSNKARKISLEGFLKMLRKAGRGHKNGLLHYTTMPSFKSMIDSRKVYFSLLNSSNDKGECNDNRHYMMCFTYGIEENVGLWGIYGIPWKESIWLKFPNRDIMDWLESAKNKELQYYGVRNRGNPVLLKDANPKILISDVGYYDGEHGNIFTHDRTNYRVPCNGRTGCNPCQDPRLAPYVKQWAWSYEHEVRIVLEFDKPVRNSKGQPFRRLAVDFEEPLEALLEGKGEIRLGPWYRRGRENVWKKNFPNALVVQSVFANSEHKINLRTPCQECDKLKRLKRMLCKYKKWTTGITKVV